jgi:hypothetical protein
VGQFQSVPFAAQAEAFSATFEATPAAAGINAVVALGLSEAMTFGNEYDNYGMLVRFNADGHIDVRRDGEYAADASVAYTAGTPYRVRVLADVAAGSYDVHVAAEGLPEVQIAAGYLFRTSQVGLGAFDTWGLRADAGALNVCDFAIGPPAGCVEGSDGQHQRFEFSTKRDSFVATFEIAPAQDSVDAVVGLASSPAMTSSTEYDNYAILVRLNAASTIDARDGDRYAADVVLPYAAGGRYGVRVVVDVEGRTYDVFVAPAGAAETQIAAGYRFRSTQADVAAFDRWGLLISAGAARVCSFSVADGSGEAKLRSPGGVMLLFR